MTATVLELEHAVPNIRAQAFTAWHEADQQFQAEPPRPGVERREREAFWDWAVLELLVQSGLRIEEACELTTLDVLKRQLPDGRVYYLLHVKPSKFDRARVIPIGDGLGRVIADIITHVRRFYATAQIPPCDNWECRRNRVSVIERTGHACIYIHSSRSDFLFERGAERAPRASAAIRNRRAARGVARTAGWAGGR